MIDTIDPVHISVLGASRAATCLVLICAALATATGSLVFSRKARRKAVAGEWAPIEQGWALVLVLDTILFLGSAVTLVCLQMPGL